MLCYNFIFPECKNPKLGFSRVDKGVSVPVRGGAKSLRLILLRYDTTNLEDFIEEGVSFFPQRFFSTQEIQFCYATV